MTQVHKKKFDTKYLMEELDLPYNTVNHTLFHVGNWMLFHEIVFQDKDGAYWQTHYYTEVTEDECKSFWKRQEQMNCIEVEKREITVTRWTPVEKHHE